MERSRITVFAVITAVLIAAAVMLAFIYMGFGRQTADVSFPDSTGGAESGEPGPGGTAGGGLTLAEVNPQTVQAVIQTLKRPDGYSRTLYIESFWEGGKAKYTVDSWVKNGGMRLRISADGWDETKNILIKESSCYIWYGNDTKKIYRAAIGEALADGSLYDALQMIPTYEDVLKLDKSEILEAAYVELPEGWRIKVAAEDDVLGYKEIYYISIDTGLLEAAEAYDGDAPVFRMTAGETALTAPDDSVFQIG